jgi:hypothetical protein
MRNGIGNSSGLTARALFRGCNTPYISTQSGDQPPDKKTDTEKDLPMLKHLATVALLVELSTFGAVSAFMFAGLVGSPAINFA